MSSLDGTDQSIEITITGTNDVPVNDVSGSVVEDEVSGLGDPEVGDVALSEGNELPVGEEPQLRSLSLMLKTRRLCLARTAMIF